MNTPEFISRIVQQIHDCMTARADIAAKTSHVCSRQWDNADIEALGRRIVQLEQQYRDATVTPEQPKQRKNGQFVMTSQFSIPKDWWEGYLETGVDLQKIEDIAVEWREWWAVGPGAGRRKSAPGWKRCFQNRIAQLRQWGQL